MYTFAETVLFKNKELQREFYGGPYYPEWKNLHWKTGGPYYSKYDLVQWYGNFQ